MSISRISFFPLLVFSILFSPLTTIAQHNFDETDHAYSWAAQCAEQMSPEELQFTGNFLYLLCANAVLDEEMQRFYTPLLDLTQAVRTNLADPLNPNEELLYLRALTNKIACVTKMRLLHTQMLDACLNYYDQNKTDVVENALKDLQQYASDALYDWTDQEQEKTATLLEQSSRSLTDAAQNIYAAANLHRGLRNGELPFVVEEKDKTLAIFNMLLKSTPQLSVALDKASNTLYATANHAMKVIAFGAETYKDHYHALYEIMATNNIDREYVSIMFSPEGLLAPEYKTILPHVDFMSEHILAMTQLLEQIKS